MPRLRNGWTTWHSARKLRRVRWSARRSRRRFSWYRIYKGACWRLLPSPWSLQPHRLSPNKSFLLLQNMTYTSRKPPKPGIWGWMCQVQARKPMRRSMAKRWAKAGRRTRRCARFGKWISKQATARLWRTGAWAQKACGIAAVGAQPSWVKQARTRAAEAAQCGGRRRCLTTAIALLHPKCRSSSSDPV